MSESQPHDMETEYICDGSFFVKDNITIPVFWEFFFSRLKGKRPVHQVPVVSIVT